MGSYNIPGIFQDQYKISGIYPRGSNSGSIPEVFQDGHNYSPELSGNVRCKNVRT